MASIPQVQVVVSSSSFHIHYLKKNKQTGGNMEVTAPVLVAKSKKLGTALTAASLLAAPFTGGASLAAGAAARGAMVGVQGARAAIAGKKEKTSHIYTNSESRIENMEAFTKASLEQFFEILKTN